MKRRGTILNSRNVRKAHKARGDDVTLSRWVKIPVDEREPGKNMPKRQWRLPGLDGPAGGAIQAGRSVFHRRGVKPVSAVTHVLVSGHNNVKIGRDVRKGRLFRGYWIYTLTLEERATCPVPCRHWGTCYGNNMPFAKRVQHGLELEAALREEIPRLLSVRGRAGLLIRLHALGDFYSAAYVRFWETMLEAYPRLAVFGYTAWLPQLPDGLGIGDEIARVKRRFGRRFAIRWSNGGRRKDCTVSIRAASQAPAGAFICPEQTGRTAACATCGLCWGTTRNVAFIEH